MGRYDSSPRNSIFFSEKVGERILADMVMKLLVDRKIHPSIAPVLSRFEI